VAYDGWSVVTTFGDRISAQALEGLLESEGLQCLLVSNGPIPGLGTQFAVLVPADALQKAQSIREQAHVSDAELTYLATGELPGGAKEP
jgi:Putative prokaryotic signal transducing protein